MALRDPSHQGLLAMAFSAVAMAAPMGRQATKVGLGGGAWLGPV